jgi:3-hydroxyisobutyrate dehydrogenase-like beta-hydroxyacid dehydrogenase
MTKPKIGFIGLGLMGAAIVSRLQDLQYSVTVCANKSRPKIDAAVARGAIEVMTARNVAEQSDIIMLCMDTSASVEARVRGSDGLISGLKPQAVVIDFGTSLPNSTRTLGSEVTASGGFYLDAPLGRTPTHALEGKLNIMASGDKLAFDVFHLGALGSGHTIKLINNFFGMTVANAMAEAFAIADIAGVDRAQMHSVMAAGPLHSGMMDFVKAYAVDDDPNQLAFAIKNAAKDVGYYTQMAQDAGVESFMSQGALTALTAAIKQGRGDEMVSQMVDFYVDAFKR